MFKLFQVIFNAVFAGQGLPPYRYTVVENLAGMSQREIRDYTKTVLHTYNQVVLLNCHYKPKYGEYVYWVKPVESMFDDSEPYPIPAGYLV